LLQIKALDTLDTDKEVITMAKKPTKKPTQQKPTQKPTTKPTAPKKPQAKSGK
jgi:hypothetical protein